jgi:membrane-associated phospholipid phosphatase
VTALAAAGRRYLPRGWTDLGAQIAIWVGFYVGYLAVRSLVDRDQTKAILNGLRVIEFEQRTTHHLLEQTAQRIADSSHVLLTAAAWTYWNSEFTVISLALAWVYFRRHERFARLRNTVLLANLIGLIGYAVMPTAPPWMFPGFGFVDGVNHQSHFLGAFANQYAAMPSLHAADALIIGVLLAGTCRRWYSKALWALWPAWVWFCVVATANHFVLDVVAGIGVAVLSLLLVAWVPRVVQRARRRVPIANVL